MQGAGDRFSSFLVVERARHAKHLRFTGLVAALGAVLLYQTQWLSLRPGLAILLAGQVSVSLTLLLRNAKLSKDLDRTKTGALEETAFSGWFRGEEYFVKYLSLFEAGYQLCGFLALAYGFWISTDIVWLSLAIGFVYPAAVYFGVTRRRNLETVRQLRLNAGEVGRHTLSTTHAGA